MSIRAKTCSLTLLIQFTVFSQQCSKTKMVEIIIFYHCSFLKLFVLDKSPRLFDQVFVEANQLVVTAGRKHVYISF